MLVQATANDPVGQDAAHENVGPINPPPADTQQVCVEAHWQPTAPPSPPAMASEAPLLLPVPLLLPLPEPPLEPPELERPLSPPVPPLLTVDPPHATTSALPREIAKRNGGFFKVLPPRLKGAAFESAADLKVPGREDNKAARTKFVLVPATEHPLD